MLNSNSEYFKRECPNCGEFSYTGYYCLSCKVLSREPISYTPITDGSREGLVVGRYQANGKTIYQIEWENIFDLDELSIDEFAALSEKVLTIAQTRDTLRNSYAAIREKLWEIMEREIRPFIYDLVPKEYDPEFVINHLQLQLNIHLDADIIQNTLSHIVDGEPSKETKLSWFSRIAHKQNGRSRQRVKMLRAIPEESLQIDQLGCVEAMYRDRDLLRYDVDFDDKIVKGLVEGVDFEMLILNVILRDKDDNDDDNPDNLPS